MYIRCNNCRTATWIHGSGPVKTNQTLACQHCGRSYRVEASADLGTSEREQYQTVTRFAAEAAIDLPSAYSIKLGLFTLEQARELQTGAVSAPAPADRSAGGSTPTVSSGPRKGASYDFAFRPAVEAGQLTVEQAIERGNRNAYGTRLASRHKLPLELAFEVADNRLSIKAALEKYKVRRETVHARREGRPVAKERKPNPVLLVTPTVEQARAAVSSLPRQLTAGVLGLLIVASLGWYSWHSWRKIVQENRAAEELSLASARTMARARPDPPAVESAQLRGETAERDDGLVRSDEQGRLLEVGGRTAREVLLTYCRLADESGRLEPVEITSTIPPHPGTRLGVFRDYRQLSSTYAIKIQRNVQTSFWFAGTGLEPIEPISDPRIAPSAPSIAVAAN